MDDRISKRLAELTEAEARLTAQLHAVQGALSVLRELATPAPSVDGAATEAPTDAPATGANGHDTDALTR